MINSLDQKIVSITPPAAILNNGSFTCAAIDTLDFDWADIIVSLGALDIAITALKLTECDTSGGAYTDCPNGNFNTGKDAAGVATTLPSATDDNHFFGLHVDLRGRKRFLKLVATMGNGATGGFLTAFALLSRPQLGLTGAAAKGLTNEIYVR